MFTFKQTEWSSRIELQSRKGIEREDGPCIYSAARPSVSQTTLVSPSRKHSTAANNQPAKMRTWERRPGHTQSEHKKKKKHLTAIQLNITVVAHVFFSTHLRPLSFLLLLFFGISAARSKCRLSTTDRSRLRSSLKHH